MRHMLVICFAFICVFSSAQNAVAAPQTMIEKICGFIVKKNKGSFSKEALEQLSSPKRTAYFDKICANPKLVLNVGPLSMYQADQNLGLIYVDRQGALRSIYSFPKFNFKISQAAVTMNDGVILPTYIMTPNDQPSRGTLFERTPYMALGVEMWAYPMSLASQGFTVILQPARGTFLAGGEFEWLDWKREAQDAKSSLDWMSQFPWGKNVIAMGTSYNAFLAMAAGTTQHPNLLAVIAASGPWNPSQDSLSANGYALGALDYLNGLNWDGGLSTGDIENSPFASLVSAYKLKTLPEAVERSRKIFNLKLKTLSPDQLNRNSQDFVEALKKTPVIMFYGFGIKDDQDSREVINLARELKGVKHHYFFAHNEGHSYVPLLSNVLTSYVTDGTTREKLAAKYKLNDLGPYCYIVSYGVENCRNELPFFEMTPLKFHFDDSHPLEASNLGFKLQRGAGFHIRGQREVQIEIELNDKRKDLIFGVQFAICESPVRCTTLQGKGSSMLTALKPGKHIYKLISQHEDYDVSWGDLYIRFGVVTNLGKEVKETVNVKFNSVDVMIPTASELIKIN